MTTKKKKPSQKLQMWIDARKRHCLSHAHIQMARELGMNPTKLGKLDNHKQEPWKLPLAQFIEALYDKRFGKTVQDQVLSIEQCARLAQQKQEARKAAKLLRPRQSQVPTTSEQHQPGTHATPIHDEDNMLILQQLTRMA